MDTVPRIIKFAYDKYELTEKGTTARCKFCTTKSTVISEKQRTTSNYVKHVQRVHPERYSHVLYEQ